jgi:hypothetical protein
LIAGAVKGQIDFQDSKQDMVQPVDQLSSLEKRLLLLTTNISEMRIRSDERAKVTHERFNIFR